MDITINNINNNFNKNKSKGIFLERPIWKKIIIKRIYDEYICQKCNGRGCKVCDNKGTLDWIKNITKG